MDSLLGKLKIIIKKKGLIVPDAISRIKSFFNSSKLFQLIDMEKGLWECAKCGKRCRDSSFERQHPKRANNDYE